MYEIPVFCVLYRCNLTLAITMEHSNSQNNPFIYLVNKLLEDSFINLPKTAFFFLKTLISLGFVWFLE